MHHLSILLRYLFVISLSADQRSVPDDSVRTWIGMIVVTLRRNNDALPDFPDPRTVCVCVG